MTTCLDIHRHTSELFDQYSTKQLLCYPVYIDTKSYDLNVYGRRPLN